MNKKIKHIVPVSIFGFFLFFSIFLFKALSSEILDYRCNACNSSGRCTENIYSKPCSDDCSSCEKFTCEICSGTSCVSRTFNTPCSDNCATDYGCGAGSTQDAMSCKVCSGNQCVSKMFEGLDCDDECTGAENCGGTTAFSEKEKRYRCTGAPDWQCRSSSNGSYESQSDCEKNCAPYICNVCKKQALFFGNWRWICVSETFNTRCDNECNDASECGEEISIILITRYSCNTSTWTCSSDSNGAYTSLATCQANCLAPSISGGCPSGQTKPHRECR